MSAYFTTIHLSEFCLGHDGELNYGEPVIRTCQVLMLFLTLVGLGIRAADLPVRIHDTHQEFCDHEHDHEHDHPDDAPCHEHDDHHHCHCPSLSPLFCLPEFPVSAGRTILLVSSATVEQIQWGLPDDPVYTPEIPPIIG